MGAKAEYGNGLCHRFPIYAHRPFSVEMEVDESGLMFHIEQPQKWGKNKGWQRVSIMLSIVVAGCWFWVFWNSGGLLYGIGFLVFWGCILATQCVLMQRSIFVSSREGAMVYRVTPWRRISRVAWSSVQSIKLGPAYVQLNGPEGQHRISLGWASREQLLQIKRAVALEANSQGVTVVEAKVAGL